MVCRHVTGRVSSNNKDKHKRSTATSKKKKKTQSRPLLHFSVPLSTKVFPMKNMGVVKKCRGSRPFNFSPPSHCVAVIWLCLVRFVFPFLDWPPSRVVPPAPYLPVMSSSVRKENARKRQKLLNLFLCCDLQLSFCFSALTSTVCRVVLVIVIPENGACFTTSLWTELTWAALKKKGRSKQFVFCTFVRTRDLWSIDLFLAWPVIYFACTVKSLLISLVSSSANKMTP